MAKLIEVIVTDYCRGAGNERDPCRRVIQYWSKNGELLAEDDPLAPVYDGNTWHSSNEKEGVA